MHLIIIGGGYSGVSMAVQAARYAPIALKITIVEPAVALGQGLAYSTSDPDHRINGPFHTHSVDPLDTFHGVEWADQVALLKDDPDAQCATGLFPRRRDFARYLADAFAAEAASNKSGSSLSHIQGEVSGLEPEAKQVRVRLNGQDDLIADQVVLAIGNPPPRLPGALAPWSEHPAMISNPWQSGGLSSIAPDAAVTVMGSSLTAADVLATLMRNQHRGPITVFSRRGLRPREQRPPEEGAKPLPQTWLVDRINGPVPPFIAKPLRADPTVRSLLRAVRKEIAERATRGEPWQAAFDEMRDVVWKIWPRLSTFEQKRYLRQIRPWYDVHRFRMSPPTDGLLLPAEARGQIRFLAARLSEISDADTASPALQVSLMGSGGPLDALRSEAFVNCTGLDLHGAPPAGSLAANLLEVGLLSSHPSGLGYAVNEQNRLIGADGIAVPRIRLIGPATAGCFGDPLGALFISAQVYRLLPGLFSTSG